MILIIGSPVASIRFPRQRTRPFNIRTLPITLPATPIFIPTALGPPVEATGMAGGPSAQAWDGRPSLWANGLWIPVSAGLLPATSLGAGLPIIMVAGSLTPPAADGFIRPLLTMAMEVTEDTQSGALRPSSIRLARSITQRQLFSFAKTD